MFNYEISIFGGIISCNGSTTLKDACKKKHLHKSNTFFTTLRTYKFYFYDLLDATKTLCKRFSVFLLWWVFITDNLFINLIY